MPRRRAGDPSLPENILTPAPALVGPRLRRLAWDSEFFDLAVARVDSPGLDEPGIEGLLAACESERIDLLYFLCDSADPQSIRIAERHGFVLTGLRFEMELRLEPAAAPAVGHASHAATRDPLDADREPLAEIARVAFGDSRFFNDPRIPEERAQALYAVWLDRCLAAADCRVRVEGPCGAPVGFIATSGEGAPRARIELLATAAASRGAGIATRLVGDAVARARAAGSVSLQVVTQGRSIDALRLYQRAGFVSTATGLWYHRWFDR